MSRTPARSGGPKRHRRAGRNFRYGQFRIYPATPIRHPHGAPPSSRCALTEEVKFAADSALVEAVTSELVSETTISGLLECGWGLSDR
jgi:hypothetical protein